MKNIIYFLFIGLFIISCQPNKPANADQAEETTAGNPLTESSSVFKVAAIPSFIVDNAVDDKGNPKSTISIDMFGQKIYVTDAAVECQRIKKEDYGNYQIPATAVDARGGWWAGGGEYFYIIKNEGVDYYSIMQTKVSEEQKSSGYDYQSIMTFTKKKN